MTRDELWMQMWQQYMDFLHKNKRRPSKYYPEERKLVNWMKHNRKSRNQGTFLPKREDRFSQLLEEAKKYQRTNQHAYIYLNDTPPMRIRPFLDVDETDNLEGGNIEGLNNVETNNIEERIK